MWTKLHITKPRLTANGTLKLRITGLLWGESMGGSVHKAPIMRKAFPCHDVIVMSWDIHDDVIEWKHFPRYWPFVRGIHRSPVNSPHKGQWRGAMMFSVICAWINSWVNNREAGDLRRHRAHYDVIVMTKKCLKYFSKEVLNNISLIIYTNFYRCYTFGGQYSLRRILLWTLVALSKDVTGVLCCHLSHNKFLSWYSNFRYPYVGNINAPICFFYLFYHTIFAKYH